MIIENAGPFLVGRLEDPRLSEKDRQALLALANEETEEELIDLMDEADAIADPLALYDVCPVLLLPICHHCFCLHLLLLYCSVHLRLFAANC